MAGFLNRVIGAFTSWSFWGSKPQKPACNAHGIKDDLEQAEHKTLPVHTATEGTVGKENTPEADAQNATSQEETSEQPDSRHIDLGKILFDVVDTVPPEQTPRRALADLSNTEPATPASGSSRFVLQNGQVKGIANTIRKYDEHRPVRVIAEPFEERVSRVIEREQKLLVASTDKDEADDAAS